MIRRRRRTRRGCKLDGKGKQQTIGNGGMGDNAIKGMRRVEPNLHIQKWRGCHLHCYSNELADELKLKFRKYPAIHTNYSSSNCTISN